MPGDITLHSLLQEEDCLSGAGLYSSPPSRFVLCLESFLSSDKKHFKSLVFFFGPAAQAVLQPNSVLPKAELTRNSVPVQSPGSREVDR